MSCKDCAADPSPGRLRCEDCSAAHNAAERVRRWERKRLHLCWVCGEKAEKVGRLYLTTCPIHRVYFATRGRVET